MENEERVEEEINFEEIIKFFKKNKNYIYIGILCVIIGLGIYVRSKSIPLYKDRLLGLDPYVFYRYTSYLVKNGYLPYEDNMRYFPIGFKTFREHQVITYFIAGLYTIFHPIFGGKLIQYSIIYPVVSFGISMIFFYLLIKEYFNKKVALIASAFLAFAPSYLFRTVAGFADKEAMATMIWFVMLYIFVKAINEKEIKKALLLGLASGVFGGLAGLTWGGAKFILVSMGATYLILTLTNNVKNNKILIYISWLIPTLLMNATLTLRYNGFKLIEEDMFAVPTLAGLVGVYKYFCNKTRKSHRFFIASLLMAGIGGLIILTFTGFNTAGKIKGVIDTIIAPFGTCPFCVSVSENQALYFYSSSAYGIDWWHRLQWFIPLFVIGAGYLFNESIKTKIPLKKKIPLISAFLIFIIFFMFSKFTNLPGFELVNIFFASTYLYTLPLFGIALFYYSYKYKIKFDETKLFIIMWFSLCVIATRGAVRIIFASTPVFVMLSAYSIEKIEQEIKKHTSDKVYIYSVYAIPILVLFWAFPQTYSSIFTPSFTDDWQRTMDWVQANTSPNDVFTHWWDYGYWVQTMGNRTTTVDGGNYYIKFDEVIGGKLFSAYNLSEAYESLKYFKDNKTGKMPNYFLIVDDDVLKYVQMANIGGRPGYYSAFGYATQINNTFYDYDKYPVMAIFNHLGAPGSLGKDEVINNVLYPKDQSYVVSVLIPINNTGYGQPAALIYNVLTGRKDIIMYKCVCTYDKGCTYYNITGIDSCIEFIKGGLIHIPSNLKDRLMTRLYLLDEKIPGFKKVYSINNLTLEGVLYQSDPTNIVIYEINYTEMKNAIKNNYKW